jgi:2-deoxy-D-gluconate 3-dehydrogenase
MARGLQAVGAEVAILSRSERVFRVAQEDGFLPIQADLSDRADLKRGFREAVEKLGGLDILINSHGVQQRHKAEQFPIEDWDAVIEVNLTSVFEMCQLAAHIMLEKGHGKIINVASMLTFSGGVEIPAYAASKGGVGQLTKALANEWAGRGINVNAIAPGYLASDMIRPLMDDPVRGRQLLERIPAGRWGAPDDLRGTAVFLASRASDYVHGAIIPVDGGWLAR